MKSTQGSFEKWLDFFLYSFGIVGGAIAMLQRLRYCRIGENVYRNLSFYKILEIIYVHFWFGVFYEKFVKNV